jgi:hypothetical protein
MPFLLPRIPLRLGFLLHLALQIRVLSNLCRSYIRIPSLLVHHLLKLFQIHANMRFSQSFQDPLPLYHHFVLAYRIKVIASKVSSIQDVRFVDPHPQIPDVEIFRLRYPYLNWQITASQYLSPKPMLLSLTTGNTTAVVGIPRVQSRILTEA